MCKDSVNKQLFVKMCDIFLHVYGRLFYNNKNGGINMLKKVFAMSTTVVLAAGLLSGCGTKESSASKMKIRKRVCTEDFKCSICSFSKCRYVRGEGKTT